MHSFKQAQPELASIRTLPAGKLLKEDAQADFWVLLSPGGKTAKVDAVKFISGSEKLRPFAAKLRDLEYRPDVPRRFPHKAHSPRNTRMLGIHRRLHLYVDTPRGCAFVKLIVEDLQIKKTVRQRPPAQPRIMFGLLDFHYFFFFHRGEVFDLLRFRMSQLLQFVQRPLLLVLADFLFLLELLHRFLDVAPNIANAVR